MAKKRKLFVKTQTAIKVASCIIGSATSVAVYLGLDYAYRHGRADVFDEIYENVKQPKLGAEVKSSWGGKYRVMHLFSEESVDLFIQDEKNQITASNRVESL